MNSNLYPAKAKPAFAPQLQTISEEEDSSVTTRAAFSVLLWLQRRRIRISCATARRCLQHPGLSLNCLSHAFENAQVTCGAAESNIYQAHFSLRACSLALAERFRAATPATIGLLGDRQAEGFSFSGHAR